jgi:hypothetical protein
VTPEAGLDSPRDGSRPRGDAWLLGAASLVVQVPFLARGLSHLDEGSMLAIADGLERGERLYADRVTLLAPLAYELLAALFGLLGPSLVVGRALQAFVFTGCVLLVHAILRELAGPRAAFWGAIAFLALKPLAFPMWTIVNYSQLAMLFACSGILACLGHLARRRGPWLLATGVGIGLTLATKQNLGALLAVAVACALLLEGRAPGRDPGSLRSRVTRVGAGVALVIGGLGAAYARRGTLGALLDRAILGFGAFPAANWIPPPGLGLGPDDWRAWTFCYLPSSLVGLGLEGRLALPPGWAVVLQPLVVAVYALPFLFAGLAAFAFGARGSPARTSNAARSGGALVLVFCASAHASMLYRADWAHLMNVYPAAILLAGVGLAPWCRRLRVARIATAALLAAWLAAGLALAALVIGSYRSPVESPRGRILELPLAAAEANRVLEYASGRPAGERLAFLPAAPLYAFLAERRLALPFDFLLPGILTERDDARVAEGLRGVGRIVYQPGTNPSVRVPITEYAPRSAARLAREFGVERILGRGALVLAPRLQPAEAASLDLVDRVRPAPEAESGVARRSWMMYRVLAARLDAQHGPVCFDLSHEVRRGDVVAFVPMLHPDTWWWERADPGRTRARFEVRARGAGGAELRVYDEEIAAEPPVHARAALDALPDGRTGLRFCVSRAGAGPGATTLSAGWGELRISRALP